MAECSICGLRELVTPREKGLGRCYFCEAEILGKFETIKRPVISGAHGLRRS